MAMPLRRNNKMKKKYWFIGIVVLLGGVLFSAAYYERINNKKTCCLNLRNYNLVINSFGINEDCHEVWKDAKKTELRALNRFEMKIPDCPSGGSCSIVYGRGELPWLPRLVCSLESTHGHIDPAIKSSEDKSTK